MDVQIYEFAKQQAEICKVFGNANRILILWALGSREMSVGEIAEAIGSSLQNTSQHLRLMKDKGILSSRREGHAVCYWIAGSELLAGCRIMGYALRGTALNERKVILGSCQEYSYQEVLPMSDIDLSTIEAAKVVDARGSACPGPLLEAKKGIGAVAVGAVLEIWSGDSNTKNDIPKWAQKVGHEYLGSLEADGYDRIFIKRSK